MKKFAIGAAAAVAMATFAGSANAEMTEVEIVLVKADQNDDSQLSKAEVLDAAIEQFIIADVDGNGLVEKDEAEDMASDPEFTDNDSDKDGSLSVDEMIEEKLADFAKADGNSDGFLSVEEFGAASGQ